MDVIELSEYYKKYVTVDAAFMIPRTVVLENIPNSDSEYVFFNGLLIKDDCYTIIEKILTFDSGLAIKIGDQIDIRYTV